MDAHTSPLTNIPQDKKKNWSMVMNLFSSFNALRSLMKLSPIFTLPTAWSLDLSHLCQTPVQKLGSEQSQKAQRNCFGIFLPVLL